MVDKLKVLKTYLGIINTEKDDVLGIVLFNTEELVKNYCNITEIPEGLRYTVVRMAAELFRNEQPGSSENVQTVKSMSEGDTSVSFGTAEASGFADSVLKNYKMQLNRYRKAVFQCL